MVLFRLTWPSGKNIISAGIYESLARHWLFVWIGGSDRLACTIAWPRKTTP